MSGDPTVDGLASAVAEETLNLLFGISRPLHPFISKPAQQKS